jgi:hypothetical protein
MGAAVIEAQYDQFVSDAITEQRTIIDGLPKSDYIKKS